MEVEFRLTREDYLEFFRYYAFQRMLISKLILIAFLCCSISISVKILCVGSTRHIVIYSFLVIFLTLSVLLFAVPYGRMRYGLKKAVLKNALFYTSQKVTLGDDGVHSLLSDGDVAVRRYDSISLVGMNKKCIYYLLPHLGIFIIPVRSFSTINDATNFYGELKGACWRSGGLKNEYSSSNRNQENIRSQASGSKKLYSWWPSLFIPGVGAIAGYIFIVRGLSEFKDKKLVLLGCGGIVVTVIFFSTVGHFERDKKNDAHRYDRMVYSALNSTVKELEFYHEQNGRYPDNLQMLKPGYRLSAFVDDYSYNKETHYNDIFHYQNLGNKYTLFSVGPDSLANTKDDIYPNLKINDTSKCGLVINRVSKQ